MKWLLLFLVAVMVLVPCGLASYNFQSPSDYNYFDTKSSGTSYYAFVRSGNGGNNYIMAHEWSNPGTGYYINKNAYVMDYAAATLVDNTMTSGEAYVAIALFDASKNTIYSYGRSAALSPRNGRYEIDIVGGTANVYLNGIKLGNSTPLSVNPSYIGFGAGRYGAIAGESYAYWDDIVYGDTDDKTVLGMPEPNAYYLKKDIVNPAANGFYYTSNNTLIGSSFTSTFSRSNLSGEALVNQPIYLINRDTGTVYETENVGSASAGAKTWYVVNLTGSAPYGFYQTKLGTTVSDTIAYIANGANIYFDRQDYSAGDTATITYLIDAGYYDTSTYAYSIKIVDVYGTVIDTQNIATSSGSVTYTWTADDTQGVYYAEIIGTPNAGGADVLYNYDYATLSAYFDVTGYVHDAETEQPISGALVNASQGNTLSNATSGADGSYTVSGFLSGVPFGMNTSATSHRGYWNNFTPITSHTLHINVTLIPSSPTLTEITLGGVCRDTTYGRPIPACSVDIWNATSGQYFTRVANSVGFYNKTMLTENNRYSIEGMKLRYRNSTIYGKTAVRA